MKFTRQAADDLEFWKRSSAPTVKRIKLLLADIELHPFAGIGKPEALKHDLSGWWSRRITAPNIACCIASTTEKLKFLSVGFTTPSRKNSPL